MPIFISSLGSNQGIFFFCGTLEILGKTRQICLDVAQNGAMLLILILHIIGHLLSGDVGTKIDDSGP